MGARAASAVGCEARNREGVLVNVEEAQQKLKEGIACAEREDFDGAIAILSQIIKQMTDISLESKAQVYIQRGRCHWEMSRWNEAAHDFNAARELLPENPDANWTLCLLYLQQNKFTEAWRYADWRWKTPKFDSPRLKTSKPQWTKDSGAKRVLVWSEQGIGDQVLHLSLLHKIQELSEQVILMADVRLFPVLERSFPGVQLVAQNARIKGFDAQIPLASIGSQFIHSLDDIERCAAKSYFKPNAEKVEKLRQSIRRPGERLIGLSWHSGAPRIGNHKSVKLAELMPLFKLPNTRFVSLQYGDCYEDLYELEKQHGVKVGIIPAIDNKDDIDGLTSLMAACSAVVTVSNATGHFAGALGVPTYVLNSNKLWYWSNVRGTQSMWYPSADVYARKNVVTPWTEQINQLVEDLK